MPAKLCLIGGARPTDTPPKPNPTETEPHTFISFELRTIRVYTFRTYISAAATGYGLWRMRKATMTAPLLVSHPSTLAFSTAHPTSGHTYLKVHKKKFAQEVSHTSLRHQQNSFIQSIIEYILKQQPAKQHLHSKPKRAIFLCCLHSTVNVLK